MNFEALIINAKGRFSDPVRRVQTKRNSRSGDIANAHCKHKTPLGIGGALCFVRFAGIAI